MSEGKDYYRGYVKGYEQGLNQAWDELISLTTRGFSPREIQVMAKSKRQSINQLIKDLKLEIKEETGVDLTGNASVPTTNNKVKPGNAYVIEGSSVTRALTIINELTSDGTKGICILRSFPGNFQDGLNESIISFWLTKHESGGQIGSFPVYSPSEMGKIVTETRNFMKEEEGRIVLLEGIEYLIVQNNDLNGVLKFLQSMVDQTVATKGVLLLAIYPSAMDEKVLSNLKVNVGSML